MELNPEFKGILGVVGTGGLTEFVLPTLALPLLPAFPFPLLLVDPTVPPPPATWSTERRCVRSFSSRLHFARRFENHTYFFIWKWKNTQLIVINISAKHAHKSGIHKRVKECEKDRAIGMYKNSGKKRWKISSKMKMHVNESSSRSSSSFVTFRFFFV